MEAYFYLIGLIVSICGLLLIDWRHQLAFWYDVRRTAVTILAGMGVFILWDILGIWFGIFFHGQSQFALPYRLFPEFPIEELFFLFLLCYVTLLLYRGMDRVWRRI